MAGASGILMRHVCVLCRCAKSKDTSSRYRFRALKERFSNLSMKEQQQVEVAHLFAEQRKFGLLVRWLEDAKLARTASTSELTEYTEALVLYILRIFFLLYIDHFPYSEAEVAGICHVVSNLRENTWPTSIRDLASRCHNRWNEAAPYSSSSRLSRERSTTQ